MINSSKCYYPWLRPELVASWPEIIATLLFFNGYSIYGSTRAFFRGLSTDSYRAPFFASEHSLLYGTAYNAVFLALLFYFLYGRGWTSGDFKIKAGWRSSLQGILLLFATKIGYAATLFGMLFIIFLYQKYSHSWFFDASQSHVISYADVPSWMIIVISSIFIAYFEELLDMGYAFNQFAAKCGPLAALSLTVALRMSCHAYQGLIHVVAIGVVFLIFGVYYWHTRNLWPLIVAHIFFDTFPMDFLKFGLSFL